MKHLLFRFLRPVFPLWLLSLNPTSARAGFRFLSPIFLTFFTRKLAIDLLSDFFPVGWKVLVWLGGFSRIRFSTFNSSAYFPFGGFSEQDPFGRTRSHQQTRLICQHSPRKSIFFFQREKDIKLSWKLLSSRKKLILSSKGYLRGIFR